MQRGFAGVLVLLVGLVIIALIGGAIYFGKINTPKTTVTDTEKVNQSSSIITTDWKTYINKEGKYSINYPSNVKVYENEKYSVDGVKDPLKDTTTFLSDTLPGVNSNFQVSINYSLIRGNTTLNEFVDKNSYCVDIKSDKGERTSLDSKDAMIFENTPCGPYGMTVIYSINKGMGYIIQIETHATYAEIKNYTDQLLSTFKFN